MSKLTDILTKITGDIVLASSIEGQIVPIVIGTVKEVKVLLEGETIEYTVALSTGADNLTQAANNFQKAIDLINAQRTIAGLPPLEVPSTPVTT